MVSHSCRKEIGCIGAKLFYPDGTIQHAGVILGLKGYASHAHKGAVKDENGYFNRLVVTHNISAVTAACMVVRKSVFQKVGGFDAENLKVAYNDVDLCLKVIEAGYRNLFTPHAKLVHHESKSRGKKRNKAQQLALREESEYLVKKWGDVLKNDPAYNKNLTLLREDFSLAQLDSIVTQTYKNVEIHVFDDCSKDETTAIVKTYCDKYKNIFLYQNKVNVGFLKNFENAISSISGKYIALSDQDDIWSPSKLKLSMMAIKELEKQYPDKPALVHSDLSTIDSEGQLIQASFFKQKKINLPPQKSLMRILGHCGVMGNTILMNHLLVEKALPFPEGLKYHDYWLSLINELFGVRKTIGDSLVQYRIHNKNISNNNKLTNNRIRYLDLRNRDFPLPFKEDHREFAIKHLLDHYSLQFEEKTLISQFYDYLLFKGIRNLENLKIFLDIDEIQYKPEKSCSVEYVVGWGRKDNTKQARDYADINKLDYYALEDGFFHSMGQGVLGENSCSLVKDKKGIYYDATQSSDLEELINAKNKKLFSLENIGRAKHAIQRITKSNISKYNNGSLKLDDTLFQTNEVVLVIDQTAGDMSLKYGYVNKNTFGEMMQAALNENPDAQIIVKTHPDVVVGKKKGNIDLDKYQGKVKIISSLVNPFVLLRKVDVVYVATSQVGFEALMLGKRVVCFGVPFYSGWGLTEDRASKELEVWDRRKSNRTLEEVFTAAYIHYPIYMNPDLNSLCEIEDVLSFFERQFLNRTRVNGRLFCFNFTLWKRNYINAFIKPLGDDLVFVRSVDQAKKMNINSSDQIVCWASKENIGVDKLASKLNIDVWNVEDGFIRSAGLGTDLTAPASLVLDKTGIYYDPNQSCDLEKILQLKKFKRTELERSNALKTALIANELSKYNLGKAFTKDSLNLNPNQKIILIPGQVEDDASIKKGTVDVSTNQGLIESVRKNNNDAFLIYKPHPDVVSGNRKGKVIKAILEANVDLVLHDASITDCLAVADEVHTMTSLVGFEALMRELKVVCYGLPFYSNWGLTTDIHNLPRRTRKLSLNELVAGTLIDYPLYYDWQLNQLTTPEVVVQQLKEKIEKQGGKQSNQISPLVRIMRKSVNFLKGVTQMENFDLDIALQDADADYNAAEAQAIACGLLVVNIASDKIAWVKLIFGDVDADNSKQHKAIKLAGELFDDIKKQLQDSNMGFDLLLPEEDESLYARVTALQQWCSGFVLGMAMSGVKDNKNLPEDSRELLADITEIGTEGEFDLDDVEQSEEAYAEIKKDPKTEQWTGRMAGLVGAVETYGASDAFPIEDIDEILPGLMENRNKVYYSVGNNQDFDNQVISWVNSLRAKVRNGIQAPHEFISLDVMLHEMRLFKSKQEQALMRDAAKVSVNAHQRAMKVCKPNMMEYEIDAEYMHEFRASGMVPAYTSIVGGGENACILHYIDNNQKLNDGDLLLIDAGAENQGYASDITRTFPVGGTFSEEQRILYQIVLDAQYAAIEMAKPGNRWIDPHDAAVRVITAGLVENGLLKGDGDYKISEEWRELEPGMTLTVEPGIYVSPSDDVDKKWWNIGIRIEDDVLITEAGNEVLTGALIKEIDDIENWMAS
ncbi:Capsule polysaccharide modification protein LipA [Nymphon striatum]|nr:Capsule polysaccharide modification protein LipA [Nymphon striatum]